MWRHISVLALVIMCMAACDDTPRLTIQAYADQCAAIRRNEADPSTLSVGWQWHDWLFNHVDAFEQLNPPSELADYHRTYIDIMSVFRDEASLFVPQGMVQSELVAGLLRHTQTEDPKLHRAYAALSDDIRQILHDAGCRSLGAEATD